MSISFSSIYRLQLDASLNFRKVIELLPYFKRLGVEGMYFSPYFEADGSHGYAVTNPNQIDSILGSQADYEELVFCLHKIGLAHVIDVVPNHMGVMLGKNSWWQDLLSQGRNSPYAYFFDINWEPNKKELKNKIFLPILTTSYDLALKNKEIKLIKNKEGMFFLYKQTPLPLCKESFPQEKDIDIINENPDDMHALLEKQHYHLGSWHMASPEINYRSFFNIHDLVALRMENEATLEAHHSLLFTLMKEKKVDCVRIDHPDGLYDPSTYFKKLKKVASLPIIVEKIFFRQEGIPSSWKVEGSVGYDYLNYLNGIFIMQKNEDKLTSLYEAFIGEALDFESLLYQSKKLYLHDFMINEVERLASILEELVEGDFAFRDLSRLEFIEVIQEVIAAFPVYRSYIEPEGAPSDLDRKYFKEAFIRARKEATHIDNSLFDLLEQIFLYKDEQRYREFILRFQQLTAPVMAKGLEDTCFYLYNRLLSLNEVGGDPARFGYSLSEFHRHNQNKVGSLHFLPSSTHDTKQSEDVRMRLNVLSELPEEWEQLLNQWNSYFISEKNVGYFFYQALLGAWPQSEEDIETFYCRFTSLVKKFLREMQESTNWITPNEDYENKVLECLKNIFHSKSTFLDTFLPFQKKVDYLGTLNSLSAQVVRLGSPGIVDIYQGNEQLHYALVDPDNRRPVDFVKLQQKLNCAQLSQPADLYESGSFDLLKMCLIQHALSLRTEKNSFFLHAEYIPLEVLGEKKEHVIAYMRQLEQEVVIVLASRFYSGLGKAIGDCWEGCVVVLPSFIERGEYSDLFTKNRMILDKGYTLSLAKVFHRLPFSMLVH